jgi:vancomycin resistance protein YoaR
MKKKNWALTILVTGSLIGLVGCSKDTEQETLLEKRIAELEKQLVQVKEEKAELIQKLDEKENVTDQPKEAVPVEIVVVDPRTQDVIQTLKPKEMGYETNKEQYQAEIKKWVRTLARGTEKIDGYDKRQVPDKLGNNGEIIKGVPRTILEEAELIAKIMNASEMGGRIDLPIYITESGYQPEEVSQLEEVVVASYTTYFNSGVEGRTKNIELSSAAIHNVIVGTDDIFSFNTTVGPSDAAHGYQPAPEILNGKLVDGIGGGICQTSSTLYNAVDKLGIAYVEKHNHSLNVGYVPKGRDATVSYGGLDFRFKNTTGIPFIIKTSIKDGSLTVNITTSAANQKKLKTSTH